MGEEGKLADLRAELRAWLSTNLPGDWRERQRGDDIEGFLASQRDWLARLVKGGYATPHWSGAWHGGGRSLAEQVAIFEELARADAPRLTLFFVSLYHAAMTLQEFGTKAQQERHLPAILAGETWCQGFSEPGAGSDLAALRTRAERKGDRYVISGQKIWSTLGQFADHCLLLVRTDTSGPKQAGITFLLMDMKSKGVDVRPIKQITGDEEFAEIFLDEVEIPVENLVGKENEGWAVAQYTLSSERGLALVELTERLALGFDRLVAEATRGGTEADRVDAETRRRIVDISARLTGLRAMIATLMANRIAGNEAVGDASIIKLAYSRLSRDFTALGLRLRAGLAMRETAYVLGAGYETGNWMFDFLNSYQYNIAGGTNEIQRNIISERVLMMPRQKLA
ncbi:acyl-CoA dehydrogenase family protein [Novosphingobium sp. KCTC 2891]|uniref:acyl-CoA dehydrogenase family protein n=1 Tax=Novosphingobium sp. KCTC 2891 TaxID=2989730 RepID=UPI002222C0AF|nr:acyl-CoA dehydrogenase family protein [Novosphingobium sp. KCTC 2891]MCW1385127.1 acyl-CoA dehydrogenase family protein [Novosphingobium sp. KCTC 2891]